MVEEWIIDFIEQFGYAGVFFLIALENVFPPIPSEIILTFGGFATTTSSLHIPGVVAASTLGSVFGALILYGIGRLIDIDRMEILVGKYGRCLRISKKDIRRAESWFTKYGVWTIFLCRMIPLVRSLISIPAGMSKMNISVFLLFTTAGTLIWNIILVNLGAAVGESWTDILEFLDIYSSIAYVCIGIALLWVLFLFFKRFQTNGKKEEINR